MQALEDQQPELELDSLSHWKPVQTVPYIVRYGVKLAFSHDLFAKNRVQSIQEVLCDSGKPLLQ